MEDKVLKAHLQHALRQEVQPERLEETINSCIEVMRKQKFTAEARTGFWGYLLDVFRFEGIPILGLQAITLLLVSQYYGMSEMEAVTRASGAQIMLAKLILSGAANLVCITILLFMETYQQNSCKGIGQMILYCLVPYLVCMVGLLRVIRMRKKEGLPVCVFIMLGSCVFWGLSANALPWLYEATATGLWLIMFVVFSAFFLQEIRYIAAIRKEGKMYGIIA